MQLPPADELVLVSGMPPIRAQKLRYFADRNFRGRLACPPELSGAEYPDKPEPRADDWGRQRRTMDVRLEQPKPAKAREKEGGRVQQRLPGLDEEAPAKPKKPRQIDVLGFERDDADPATDKRAMDQARANTLVRAHAINQSPGDPAVPEF
jgi:type IV secretion system protein VirD4